MDWAVTGGMVQIGIQVQYRVLSHLYIREVSDLLKSHSRKSHFLSNSVHSKTFLKVRSYIKQLYSVKQVEQTKTNVN